MSRWGKGGFVGIRKAIFEHERAQKVAARILEVEHGKRHQPGERCDLCPTCIGENIKGNADDRNR